MAGVAGWRSWGGGGGGVAVLGVAGVAGGGKWGGHPIFYLNFQFLTKNKFSFKIKKLKKSREKNRQQKSCKLKNMKSFRVYFLGTVFSYCQIYMF